MLPLLNPEETERHQVHLSHPKRVVFVSNGQFGTLSRHILHLKTFSGHQGAKERELQPRFMEMVLPHPVFGEPICPAAFNQVYPRCYHFRPKPQLPPDEIPENGTVKFLEPPEDCTP